MLERFQAHLESTGLLTKRDRVVVGYSGGGDSTALVHLLAGSGYDFVAAHLHHGQREEADEELARCEAFCKELDVPFLAGRADVPRLARDLKIGLEEAGRHARYAFLEAAARQLGCNLIATAHTKDDHVETVIFNLTRGSGLAGVAGIRQKRGHIVRPLLPFARAETRAYCKDHGLWTHDDPANTDVAFARARIRLRVIPELRAINPKMDDAIVRFGTIASEEDAFLDSAAAAGLERAEIKLNGDLSFLTSDCEVAFSRKMLLHQPPVLLRRAVRLAAQTLDAEWNSAQCESILSGIQTSPSGSVTAEGGQTVVEWDAEKVHFRRLLVTAPYRFKITVPGETSSDEFGWTIEAFAASPRAGRSKRQAMEVDLNVRGELYLRSFKAGDSMRPLGFEGTRKVSDLLGEAHLTEAARFRLPIICDMIGPIWIPGICVDERAKITDRADKAIHIRFRPIRPNETSRTETRKDTEA